MHFGATMWFTATSISPAELATALEERGFESLWASEHSHLPATGDSGEADVQARVTDPFVTLAAAAMSTKTLKLGTGICLVNQRDPIQTAKLVASLDQLSSGRFLFGIGNGWHEEEMRDHGTAFATRHHLVRERVEAMRAIWTQEKAAYQGEFVSFGPMIIARLRALTSLPLVQKGAAESGPRPLAWRLLDQNSPQDRSRRPSSRLSPDPRRGERQHAVRDIARHRPRRPPAHRDNRQGI